MNVKHTAPFDAAGHGTPAQPLRTRQPSCAERWYQPTRRAGGQPLRQTRQGPLLSSQRASGRMRLVTRYTCSSNSASAMSVQSISSGCDRCGGTHRKSPRLSTNRNPAALSDTGAEFVVEAVDHCIDLRSAAHGLNRVNRAHALGNLRGDQLADVLGLGHLSSPCFDDPIYPQSAYGVNNEIRNVRMFLP